MQNNKNWIYIYSKIISFKFISIKRNFDLCTLIEIYAMLSENEKYRTC